MHNLITLLLMAATLLPRAVSVGGGLPTVPSQAVVTYPATEYEPESLKVPGESPAYHCSDPSKDLYKIWSLDFLPTNPRVGHYLRIRFIVKFDSSTGDVPWLNVTGFLNGHADLGEMFYGPLCDLEVFQDIWVPRPGRDGEVGEHRSCPPAIHGGYAVITSKPIPLYPFAVPVGRYDIRAEAMT